MKLVLVGTILAFLGITSTSLLANHKEPDSNSTIFGPLFCEIASPIWVHTEDLDYLISQAHRRNGQTLVEVIIDHNDSWIEHCE